MLLSDTKSTQVEEASLLEGNDANLVIEDEDDEEDDVDFNPFLRDVSSPEASSSISSDDKEEGIVANDVEKENLNFVSETIEVVQDCSKGDEQEVRVEDGVSEERAKKRKLMEKSCSSIGDGEPVDAMRNVNDDVDVDVEEEDAICRRTRARYSLANCSLDELETFLQETDHEDDMHNVDDEQEYRKFLAAVLLGENDGQSVHENENADDEDEDSDADFELEIEEMLDSDFDETMRGKKREERRRPNTRQNNCNRKSFVAQVNRPLRPIVPLHPPACFDWQSLSPDGYPNCPPSFQVGVVSGFSPHQLGQLHCLIHEHTQLLVQVFSLCVLDPSRQDIADKTRKLLSELVDKRKNALSRRKVPYPDYCFRPPYIHPSVSDELPMVSNDSSSPGRRFDDVGGVNSLQTTNGPLWVPRLKGSVLSILDAAPLSLVGSYVADVSRAVEEHQKLYLEGSYDIHFQKEPLFPFSNNPASPDASSGTLRVATSDCPTLVSSSSKGHQPPKKSMAAALVERTKKESIALAPQKIVKLAQRFYPFFSSALYPHKPPVAAVANRVYFTDSEDKLLAMGILECNTDWKAIQHRFLPCKSEHQIFVRQKNRCSSKAPENPIKTVRQMKTSPLTAEEKDRIYKGLKVFKLDWMAVWKIMVPYRDPSLLPRQWRIALGTQKSYKSDEAKRQKRQLYDKQRRMCQAAGLANWQVASEKEDTLDDNAAEGNKCENDNVEVEDEAYVHEAFLADWRPEISRFPSSEVTLGSLHRRDSQPGILPQQEKSCASEIRTGDWYGGLHPHNHEFLSSYSSQHFQNVSHFTHVRYSASYTVASTNFNPDCPSKLTKKQVSLRPRRAPRKKVDRLVKLAPDLPPVNLPPSVRVISQSAFNSYHCVTSHSTKISSIDIETENSVPGVARVAKSRMAVSADSGNKGSTPSSHITANLPQLDARVQSDQLSTVDNNADTDLQMHPLLLQAPEDGRLPYCPVNCSTRASNTFNFIEGNQLQTNFSNFFKTSDTGLTVDGSPCLKKPSNSLTIDFHPLLQRKDDGHVTQLRDSSDSIMTEPDLTSGSQATLPMPASPDEKENELDLEIHLSSTSRKGKLTAVRKVSKHVCNDSRKGLPSLGIIRQMDKDNNSSQERSEISLTAPVASSSSNQHVLDNHTLFFSNISSRSQDYMGNQSLPEIVMEQEELSDSEDENREDVEFECEEMDDSEKEESKG